MTNKLVKILWVSDIHFSSEYVQTIGSEPKFAKYFTDFVAQVKATLDEDKEAQLDYIFLTGDLAQAGVLSDYQALLEHLLCPLLDIFLDSDIPKPKVICIPGNHDINWDQSDFLEDYLSVAHELGERYEERSKYLETNYDKFASLFADYTTFLLETVSNHKGGRYREFFEISDGVNLKISVNYQRNRLFGYILDHKNHLLINLLNTAWFSLGGKFNHILAHHEARKPGWNVGKIELKEEHKGMNVEELVSANTEGMLKRVLKQKDYISEYSNQITGIHISEYDKLIADYDAYSEYFMITCMHHPLNWLQWEEHYSFKNITGNISEKLKTVLDRSNLVLTGHEHVPRNVHGEPRSQNTVLLKSGCFLFDNQHTKVSLSNSWFSMLTINPERASVEHKKIYYQTDGPVPYWQSDDRLSARKYNLFKANNGYQIETARLDHVKKMVSDTTMDKLGAALAKLLPDLSDVIEIKTLKETDWFSLFQISRSNATEICFVAKEEYIYSKILADDFYEQVAQVILDLGGKINVFRFLVLDLFIDKPILSHLSQIQIADYDSGSRSQHLQRKVNLADDMFDVFRHKFFVRFENQFGSSKDYEPVFNSVRECAFINTILPFWVAENVWRNG